MKYLADICPFCNSKMVDYHGNLCGEKDCHAAFEANTEYYCFRYDYDADGVNSEHYDIACNLTKNKTTIHDMLTGEETIIDIFYPVEEINKVIDVINKVRKHAAFK